LAGFLEIAPTLNGNVQNVPQGIDAGVEPVSAYSLRFSGAELIRRPVFDHCRGNVPSSYPVQLRPRPSDDGNLFDFRKTGLIFGGTLSLPQ